MKKMNNWLNQGLTEWFYGNCWRERRLTGTWTRRPSSTAWGRTRCSCHCRRRFRPDSCCWCACAGIPNRATGPPSRRSCSIWASPRPNWSVRIPNSTTTSRTTGAKRSASGCTSSAPRPPPASTIPTTDTITSPSLPTTIPTAIYQVHSFNSTLNEITIIRSTRCNVHGPEANPIFFPFFLHLIFFLIFLKMFLNFIFYYLIFLNYFLNFIIVNKQTIIH